MNYIAAIFNYSSNKSKWTQDGVG